MKSVDELRVSQVPGPRCQVQSVDAVNYPLLEPCSLIER